MRQAVSQEHCFHEALPEVGTTTRVANSLFTMTPKAFTAAITVLLLTLKAAATPFCCDLGFGCINNNRASEGEYKIGPRLRNEERDICSKQGRANWCVAKWTDGDWYCTSPGNFLKFSGDYKKQCRGFKWPPKTPRAGCCRASGGLRRKARFAELDL